MIAARKPLVARPMHGVDRDDCRISGTGDSAFLQSESIGIEPKRPLSRDMIWPVFNNVAAPRYGLILLYHSVLEEIPPDLAGGLHNVRPHIFAEQVDWLARHFEIMELDEFMRLGDVRGKAAITFDDAYRSVFDHGLPMLKARGLPATIFINADTMRGGAFWRDKVRYLIASDLVADFVAFRRDRWPGCPALEPATFYRQSKTQAINSRELDQQIDAFAECIKLEDDFAGLAAHIVAEDALVDDPLVAYGNHSLGHFVLSSLDRDQQSAEIRENQEALVRLKLPLSNVFAFPFGGLSDFNDDTLSILRDDGYSGAVLSRSRLNGKTRYQGFCAERWMPPDDMAWFHRRLAAMRVREMERQIK